MELLPKGDRPNRIRYKRRKVSDEFIIDKTQIRVGQDYF